MKSMRLVFVFLISVIILNSCDNNKKTTELKEPSSIEELGELLFHDSILSRGNQISCASCHKPEHAFADNTPVSALVLAQPVETRHAPTLPEYCA